MASALAIALIKGPPCDQDMEARNKSIERNRATANAARLKGNKLYSKGEYQGAIDLYMESLKSQPYDVRTLANIAQSYIRMDRWQDAMEFCNRVLFLDPTHVKSLSRRAKIHANAKEFQAALEDVRQALRCDPNNDELVEQER
jgi:tetratricopeptide (TPR) repeat protein